MLHRIATCIALQYVAPAEAGGGRHQISFLASPLFGVGSLWTTSRWCHRVVSSLGALEFFLGPALFQAMSSVGDTLQHLNDNSDKDKSDQFAALNSVLFRRFRPEIMPIFHLAYFVVLILPFHCHVFSCSFIARPIRQFSQSHHPRSRKSQDLRFRLFFFGCGFRSWHAHGMSNPEPRDPEGWKPGCHGISAISWILMDIHICHLSLLNILPRFWPSG